MLSAVTLNLLSEIINFGFYLRFHPYKFCSQGVRFEYRRSSNTAFGVSILLQILFQVYLIFRSIQMFTQYSTASTMQVYATFIYSSLNFNHWITYRFFGEHHLIINAFLEISRRERGRQRTLQHVEPESIPGEIAGSLRALCFTFAFSSLFRALAVFRKPDLPELLTSVLKNPSQLSVESKMTFFLLHFYLAGFQCYSMTLHGAVTLCYVSSICPEISSLRMRLAEERNDLTATKLHKAYNELQTLHRQFSVIYGHWPIGCQISMIGAAVINLFLAVIFLSPRFLVNGILFSLLLIGFFSRFGEMHTESVEVINSWKLTKNRGCHRTNPWFSKYLRCCRPVSIQIGGLFYADSGLVLTIVSIIIANATSLVIAFRT